MSEISAEARERCAWFHNALRVLMNIDAREFPGPEEDWRTFRDDPWRYFVRADDDVSERIYAIIEGRKRFPAPASLTEAIQAERERIARHIDCTDDCEYVGASGTCHRTNDLCAHHVAASIRAGEEP